MPEYLNIPPPYDPHPAKSQELKEAITLMLSDFPFVAQVLMTMMPMHWCPALPTAGTDGNRVYINEDYFKTLNLRQQVSLLAHETLHGIFLHMLRGLQHMNSGLGGKPFIHALYNIAADYIINALISDMHMPLGDGWLFRSVDDATRNAEDLYLELLKDVPESYWEKNLTGGEGAGGEAGEGDSSQGDNAPGAGPGAGEDPLGSGEDSHDTHIYAQPERSEVEWKQSVEAAATAAKAQGKLPGSLERLIGELMDPTIPWEEKLRSKIMKYSTKDDRTWSRPSRRHMVMNDMYLPGLTGFSSGVVGVFVDTSGSVSDEEIIQYFGEISGIFNDAQPEKIIYIPCDAICHDFLEIENPADFDVMDLPVKGRGGTSFLPPFERCIEEGVDLDFAVYLTDGCGQFPADPGYPTIWVMSTTVVSPIGETIHLK